MKNGTFTLRQIDNDQYEPNDTMEEAKEILENMAQSLGELIDSENGLLTNTLKSDKDR